MKVWTLYVGNLSEQIHWYVFDRHGRVLDSFILHKRAVDERRFGFVHMGFEEESMWKKCGVSNSGASVSKVNAEDGRRMPEVRVENRPLAELCMMRRVEGLETEDYLVVL
ncbi:hypothetical protein V6N12_059852 [Hibiscus sabdariffa]|uniref:Uncharacterized protein n=1 Tax=Hibiscus sabdariffa TaxID=183260 RepID=A0ABR2BD11_9ROSI